MSVRYICIHRATGRINHMVLFVFHTYGTIDIISKYWWTQIPVLPGRFMILDSRRGLENKAIMVKDLALT